MERHGELLVFFQIKEVKPFLKDVFDCPVMVETVSVAAQTCFDESLVTHAFSKGQYPLTGFISLFRMRSALKNNSDVVLHLLANGAGLRQEVVRVPLGHDFMLGGHV